MDSLPIILSLLTALGVGGIIGGYVQSLLQRKRELQEHEYQLKQTRYGCIIMLMLAYLNPQDDIQKLKQFRNDINNPEDIKKELMSELLNAVVFADDEVVNSLSEFTRNPNHASFVKVAVSMRKDLWGKKTNVEEQLRRVFGSDPM